MGHSNESLLVYLDADLEQLGSKYYCSSGKKLGGFARSCGLPASWRSEHIGFLVRFLESETW